MTELEIITGNDEICQMLGFESTKVYNYRVPNLFPFEDEVDTGWIECNTQQILFHTDWNMLIGAYNRMLRLIETLPSTQKDLLRQDKNFLARFSCNHFFGLFENQLSISSSWTKLVMIAQWYNGVKSLAV